jgi:hypothetical protein
MRIIIDVPERGKPETTVMTFAVDVFVAPGR